MVTQQFEDSAAESTLNDIFFNGEDPTDVPGQGKDHPGPSGLMNRALTTVASTPWFRFNKAAAHIASLTMLPMAIIKKVVTHVQDFGLADGDDRKGIRPDPPRFPAPAGISGDRPVMGHGGGQHPAQFVFVLGGHDHHVGDGSSETKCRTGRDGWARPRRRSRRDPAQTPPAGFRCRRRG
jgi:hypothetical protein